MHNKNATNDIDFYLNIKDLNFIESKETSGSYIKDGIACPYKIVYPKYDMSSLFSFYINTKDCVMFEDVKNSSCVFRFYNYIKKERQVPLTPEFKKDENNYIEIIIPDEDLGMFKSYVYLQKLIIVCYNSKYCDYITTDIRKCLYRIWAACNINKKVTITSTYRTFDNQISAMYTLIINNGTKASLALYKPKGDEIIVVLKEFLIEKLTDELNSESNLSIKDYLFCFLEMNKDAIEGLKKNAMTNKYKSYLNNSSKLKEVMAIYENIVKKTDLKKTPQESTRFIINELTEASNMSLNSSKKGHLLCFIEMMKNTKFVSESGLIKESEIQTKFQNYMSDDTKIKAVIKLFTNLIKDKKSEAQSLMKKKGSENGLRSVHQDWVQKGAIDFGKNLNGYTNTAGISEAKSLKEKTKLEKSVIKVLLPPNPGQQGEDALHIELKLK